VPLPVDLQARVSAFSRRNRGAGADGAGVRTGRSTRGDRSRCREPLLRSRPRLEPPNRAFFTAGVKWVPSDRAEPDQPC